MNQKRYIDTTQLNCLVGDLTKQSDCDAIVNSAHPSMLAGSGVCGAIHKAAGRDLEIYGKQFAPLKLTQAVITSAFNLPNKYIIHVSAPRYHAVMDPLKSLAQALRNVLKTAEEHQVERIAIPAIGAGIYGFPMSEAIGVYVQVASEFIASDVLKEIRFVFVSAEHSEAMKILLNSRSIQNS